MPSELLTETEIAALLEEHDLWQRDGRCLRRSYQFANFIDAFAFMTKVALISEKQNHHPEWSNVYNRLDIAITDHSAGGISAKDRAWIARVDKV